MLTWQEWITLVPWVFMSAAVWTAVYFASPALTKLVAPVQYAKFLAKNNNGEGCDSKGRANMRMIIDWDIHVTSHIHAAIIITLAIISLTYDELSKDHINATTPVSTAMICITSGYATFATYHLLP
jgi:hypothetical protein